MKTVLDPQSRRGDSETSDGYLNYPTPKGFQKRPEGSSDDPNEKCGLDEGFWKSHPSLALGLGGKRFERKKLRRHLKASLGRGAVTPDATKG